MSAEEKVLCNVAQHPDIILCLILTVRLSVKGFDSFKKVCDCANKDLFVGNLKS